MTMKSNKKVLLINTHLNYPNWSEGLLNDAFHQKAKEFLRHFDFDHTELDWLLFIKFKFSK